MLCNDFNYVESTKFEFKTYYFPSQTWITTIYTKHCANGLKSVTYHKNVTGVNKAKHPVRHIYFNISPLLTQGTVIELINPTNLK